MAANNFDDRNFYAILGVEKDADAEVIKKAYRKLAKKFHPDSGTPDPDAARRFQEIQEAWDVLGSPETRKFYDENGFIATNSQTVEEEAMQMLCGWVVKFFEDPFIDDSMNFDFKKKASDIFTNTRREVQGSVDVVERRTKRVNNFLRRIKFASFAAVAESLRKALVADRARLTRSMAVLDAAEKICEDVGYDMQAFDGETQKTQNFVYLSRAAGMNNRTL